jgi:hypothetical protein
MNALYDEIDKLRALNKEIYEAVKKWDEYLITDYPSNMAVKREAMKLTNKAIADYESVNKAGK